MLKLNQFTKNKKIERNLLVIIILLIIFYFICQRYYNINIIDYTYKKIDTFKEFLSNDINNTISRMQENLVEDENSNYNIIDIADFTYRNFLNLDSLFELFYYFAPALLIVIMLMIVLILDYLYFKIKYFMLYTFYDEKSDKKGEKIKNIIKNKIQEKNKVFYLPSKVPILLVSFIVFDFLFTNSNYVLGRAIQNMTGLLYIIILFYGLQLSTKFIRIKNNLIKNIYLLLNVAMFLIMPQIYFIIGFAQSLFNINIIVYKQK